MSLLLFGTGEEESMAITFVTSGADASSTTSSVNTLPGVTIPSGVRQTDDVFIVGWASDNTQTASLDANFTSEANSTDGSLRSIAASRVSDGSETGDVSLDSSPTANRQAGAISTYRGSSGIGTVASLPDTAAASTTHPSPSISLASADSGIVLIYTERVSSSATPINPPSGFTARATFATGGSGGTAVCVADKLTGNSAGSNSIGDWTTTTAASAVVVHAVELLASGSGATVTPGAVASVVSAPQATPSVSDTAAPGVVAAATTAPQATPSVSDTGAPATVAGVAALPQATATGNAAVTPAAISTAVTLPSSARNVGAGPGVLSTIVALPQATPTSAGNATASPAAVATVVSVPQVTASGTAVASPAEVATVVATPQATPHGDANAAPVAIASTVSTPTAQATVDDVAAPSVIATVAALLQASPLGSATVSPDAIVTVITLPIPHLTEPRDIIVIARLRSDHVTGDVGLTDLVAGLRSSHITGGVDVPRNMLTGSVEYVTAEVTFVGETAASIATVTGQVKITSDDTIPSSWDAADATERTDVNGGALLALKKLHTAGVAGEYRVWAKVSDNPEVPILKCGTFTVR